MSRSRAAHTVASAFVLLIVVVFGSSAAFGSVSVQPSGPSSAAAAPTTTAKSTAPAATTPSRNAEKKTSGRFNWIWAVVALVSVVLLLIRQIHRHVVYAGH